MASVRAVFGRAVAAHREAVAQVRAAQRDLERHAADTGPVDTSAVEQTRLGQRLAAAARALIPGWLGTGWDAAVLELPVGRDAAATGPVYVPVGSARAGDATFPAVVPLLGVGHLTVDADARRPEVAGLVRGVLLRLLAACPAGLVRVRTVDGGAVGATFTAFRPLVEAGVMPEPATDRAGFRAVLDEAERHVRQVQQAVSAGRDESAVPYLLVVVGSLVPDAGPELARLRALAHAGPAARLHLVVAGYPPAKGFPDPEEPLSHAVAVRVGERGCRLTDPPGAAPYSAGGLDVPVALAAGPPEKLVGAVSGRLAGALRAAGTMTFADLMTDRRWPDSSEHGLHTVVGRDGMAPVELAFDDATPHWLVGGRTGSGKTVFLLDVLYGLAARYSPDELAMYLLDFKEGVSFTEFTPTGSDPSWIPHARAVGVESDREYGVAVLAELAAEMGRRSVAMKRAGVTKLADLRSTVDIAMPRILAVVDEFHVLFAGNDALARRAAALLEELARKGRSYGVHLVLASQTTSGVEALYTKTESIFGQFPLRIALAGATGVLDPLNTAADGLPIGTAVVNDAGGIPGHNRLVRFPDAHADSARLAWLRHELWQARIPGSAPPSVFAGYAEQSLAGDPTYRALRPRARRLALVGRNVDVPSSTASFALDASPGRHLGVLGPSPVGADVLAAAAAGLAPQYEAGAVEFVLAPLVAAADAVAERAAARIAAAGHKVSTVDALGLRETLRRLADGVREVRGTPTPTYLVVFGMDAAGGLLGELDAQSRTGIDDLRVVLRQGPARGVHLLGWWRGLGRFSEDVGGSAGREDVACLVALNVPGSELGMFLGMLDLDWHPRPNRALLVDRHEDRVGLIVPFTEPRPEGE
ncbi:FtsK/SpoIIIE domain-containing protein [Actinocatenispora rupis]|uniref:Cell division protein FtsK n=1 Tax=Actinocatenispora rupis TaxID=519421 RepID=A0A8J3J2Y9_9ACTN|nr:FtsK/SpoIIIE domain-containing protein [Actinocatenispora rupis]GID14846.1 cell division protein FtsK [Actinocatenispora rupis]